MADRVPGADRVTMRVVFRLALSLLTLLAACAGQIAPPTPTPPAPPPPAPPTTTPCDDQFLFGRPLTSQPGTPLCRSGYAVLHSPVYKTPIYVAERLEAINLDGPIARTDDFRADPELPPGERSELVDYRGSGYDRGHMAPAADFTTDAARMSQSFLLSNMIPQNGSLNSGWWDSLERATRACAKTLGTVYVLSGPIYSDPVATIGPGKAGVPSNLFKIIADGGGNSKAFIVPNAAVKPGFTPYRVTVAAVEAVTELNFFSAGGVDETALGTLCPGAYGP
jgi:endonuclease G, mitochondrial